MAVNCLEKLNAPNIECAFGIAHCAICTSHTFNQLIIN